MRTFTPPVVYDVGRVLPGAGARNSFARHASPLPRGRTVIIRLNNTAYETDYPLNPDEFPPNVRFTYLGGHIYLVSDEEATILIAAGYMVADPVVVTWGALGALTWGEAEQFTWGGF